MLVSGQCFECQNEEIQPSTGKWRKFCALLQLHFLDYHAEKKIAKHMWKQSSF
jgi:hypothetical protein